MKSYYELVVAYEEKCPNYKLQSFCNNENQFPNIHNICFVKIQSKLCRVLLLCSLQIFMKQMLVKIKFNAIVIRNPWYLLV